MGAAVSPIMYRAALAVFDELERRDPTNTALAFARSVWDVEGARPSRGRPPGGLAQARRERRAERDAEDARAEQLYKSGLSVAETAKALNRSAGFVSAALQRRGVQARKQHANRVDMQRVEAVRRMRAEKKSLEEIAATFRVSRERIRQICIAHGIDHAPPEPHLDERQLRAVQEYLQGSGSLERVAARYNVGAYAFRDWILRAGFVPREPGGARGAGSKPVQHTAEVKQRAKLVADLYREGRSLDEIAAAAGLAAPEMAYRLLAIEGVEPNRRRAAAS